jgi:phosphopantothenate-cysteine ligase
MIACVPLIRKLNCCAIVDAKYAASMAETLAKYNKARSSNMLLLQDFVTLSDYLFKLKSGTRIMATLGRSAMYYLAAAVSDFFIPTEKMVSTLPL